MRNINHQNRRSLRFKISFSYFKIIFLHGETVNTMIDLSITYGFGKINLLKSISKLKRSCFRIDLITAAGFKCIMISLFCFFKLAKNFFKASFTYSLFCFRSYFYFAIFLVFGDIAFVFQFIIKSPIPYSSSVSSLNIKI